MIPARALSIWCNQTLVGQLEENNNIWSLQYAEQWDGFDLSPELPRSAGRITDGSSRRPVQWFFDNLLPEEGARTLLAESSRIDIADAFGLLAHFGAESAGALTLLNPEESPVGGGRSPLSFDALSKRVQKLPDVPLAQGKRMSLAGAQHKLPIIFEAGQLYEPDLTAPSTHILKPNRSQPQNYWHTVINEYFMMRIAQGCRMPVPQVNIIRVPEPAYLVERFDRHQVQGQLMRDHAIDACQMLSLDRSYKYSQCIPQTLSDLRAMCRAPAFSAVLLFRWLIFNLLIGNGDNHLKNLSFFMTADNPVLTPHYDLVCTAIYEPNNSWMDAELSWKLDGYTKFGSIDRGYIDALAEPLKIQERLAKTVISDLISNIGKAADQLIAEQEAIDYDGITKEGELHLMRQFRYGVFKDMSDLLSRLY